MVLMVTIEPADSRETAVQLVRLCLELLPCALSAGTLAR